MVRFWATIILCFEDSAWSRGLARKADASTDHMGQDRNKAQHQKAESHALNLRQKRHSYEYTRTTHRPFWVIPGRRWNYEVLHT